MLSASRRIRIYNYRTFKANNEVFVIDPELNSG